MNAKVFKKALVRLTLAIPFATSSSYCSSDTNPLPNTNSINDGKEMKTINEMNHMLDQNKKNLNELEKNVDNKESKKISAAVDHGNMALFMEMLKNDETKKKIIEYLKNEINAKSFDDTKVQIGDNENFQVQPSKSKKQNDLAIVKENDLKLEAIEKEKKDNNKPFEMTSANDNALTVEQAKQQIGL